MYATTHSRGQHPPCGSMRCHCTCAPAPVHPGPPHCTSTFGADCATRATRQCDHTGQQASHRGQSTLTRTGPTRHCWPDPALLAPQGHAPSRMPWGEGRKEITPQQQGVVTANHGQPLQTVRPKYIGLGALAASILARTTPRPLRAKRHLAPPCASRRRVTGSTTLMKISSTARIRVHGRGCHCPACPTVTPHIPLTRERNTMPLC